MRLFLSCEAQTPTTAKLLEFINEFDKSLDFVTNRDNNLEKVNNYGQEFEGIGVIVTCISKEMLANMDNYKERRLIKRKEKDADIRLRIEYERFILEEHEIQRLMYIDTIVRSIQVVIDRSKGDFRGQDLIDDILKALNVTQEQLDSLSKTQDFNTK